MIQYAIKWSCYIRPKRDNVPYYYIFHQFHMKSILHCGLTLVVGLVLLSTTSSAHAFSDLNGHWSEPFVNELISKKILTPGTGQFRPDEVINRSELVKMLVEAMGGVRPSLVASAPGFKDVASTAWYHPYILTAQKLGIISGYADGRFGPGDLVTREQAMKVIINALSIPRKLSPTPPFKDVTITNWSFEFVATAYNYCIVDGLNATSFGPYQNITRGQASKMISNALSPKLNCRIPSRPSKTTPPSSTTPAEEVYKEAPVSEVKAQVKVSTKSPKSQTVPRNATNVPFLVIDVTAPESEDLKLMELTVTRKGVGVARSIETVRVLDGLTKRGTDKSINSQDGTARITFGSNPVVILKGTTKSITVVADLNAVNTSEEHRLTIEKADHIVLTGTKTGNRVTANGAFPLSAASMKLSAINTGSLEFTFQNVTSNELEVGQSDAELARIQLSELTGQEGVFIKGMNLEFSGADDYSLSNLWIDVGGVKVTGTVPSLTREKALFDFTSVNPQGFYLEEGGLRTLIVRGTPIGGRDDSFQVRFDNIASDVIAVGSRLQFGVRFTEAGITKGVKVSVKGGDLSFSFESKTQDVSPGTNNVEFGKLTMVNRGEALQLKKMVLNLQVSGGGNAQHLNNIRLVNTANEKTVLGPENINTTTASNQGVSFSLSTDDFLKERETLTLSIRANVKNNAVQGGIYSFKVDMANIEVRGVTSRQNSVGGVDSSTQRHVIRPTGKIETKQITIRQPLVTFSDVITGSDTYVEREKDVVLWKGNVTTTSSKNVRLQRITFNQLGTATSSDLSDFSLYKEINNQLIPIETKKSITASKSISFTRLNEDDQTTGLLVRGGEELTLVLTADVGAQVNSSSTMLMSLIVSSTEALDSDGNKVMLSNQTNLDGSLFSLANQGSFMAYLASSTPADQIITAGGSTMSGSYVLEAQNESVEVQTLTVVVEDIDTTALLGADRLNDYQSIQSITLFNELSGREIYKKNGQVALTTSIPASGRVLFDQLDFIVPKNQSVRIGVKVQVRTMGTGVYSTAKSGMTFKTALSFQPGQSLLRGLSSGLIYGDNGINLALFGGDEVNEITALGNAVYTFQNRVIADKGFTQPPVLLAGTSQELLRVNLQSSGSGQNSAYLSQLKVQVAGTGAACISVTPDACVGGNLYLYNPSGELIAVGSLISGTNKNGTWQFRVGDDASTGMELSSRLSEIPSGGGKYYQPLRSVSEAYVIRGDIETDGSSDALSISISFNGSKPSHLNEGIHWRDSGSNGLDGFDVPWVDLGAQFKSQNRIDNVLRN
jgi:hypothetical protein